MIEVNMYCTSSNFFDMLCLKWKRTPANNLSHKCEAFDLQVGLLSDHHLWSWGIHYYHKNVI